jgi:hypothetical protein
MGMGITKPLGVSLRLSVRDSAAVWMQGIVTQAFEHPYLPSNLSFQPHSLW